MLRLQNPQAFSSCQSFLDTSLLHEAIPCKTKYVHPLISIRRSASLCRSQDATSPENEYRSSRNIAISLFRRYKNFIEPGGGDNLKEFVSAGVNAYALGSTDEGLSKELIALKESGAEIEAMETYGGSTTLKSKISAKEMSHFCITILGGVDGNWDYANSYDDKKEVE